MSRDQARPLIRLAIYDMDKTVTRYPTYTPFLIHAARTREPWRLLLLPFVFVTLLLYGARLIDRGQLKFDDVIGTKTRFSPAGDLLARIDAQNCYGTAKLEMVQAWMTREQLAREDCHIRFYSDHVSDAPCLNWADEAFATNAHAPLAALAAQRGWTVLDWR